MLFLCCPISEELSEIFETRWGGVLSARIDVDSQHAYPKGSARVNFHDAVAFMNAIQGRFIELRGEDFPSKNVCCHFAMLLHLYLPLQTNRWNKGIVPAIF